jgi:hypothetical protein
MKAFSPACALVGVLALAAFPTAGFAADLIAPEPVPRHVSAPRHVHTKHWRVIKRVVVRGCVEVSQPPRGCPVRLYGRLPWPGVPRFDAAPVYYAEAGRHRCWLGEWC